jgi:surface antigen
MGMAAYTTFDGKVIRKSLASVNAESLIIGQGGKAGDVNIGRLSTIVKPVSVPTSAPSSHSPLTYVVGDGDTLKTVSAKFAVTEESIRWSNFGSLKITTSDLKKGDVILLPPVNGAVVVVEPGDTADSLASYYRVDKQVIEDFNYLRSDHLIEGMQLVIPGARGPEFLKPAPVASFVQAPRTAPITSTLGGPAPGGYPNRFFYGYCTWYVASRVPNIPWLGDAGAWLNGARSTGWATGDIPRRGAIRVSGESWVGHVAYVEEVYPDRSYLISEMNFQGWGVVSQRKLAPGNDPALLGFIYPP